MQISTDSIKPVEYKVLIELDEVKKKTAGGILLPDERIDREQAKVATGVLIAKGGNAFEEWGDPIPQPGDRVIVDRFAGYSLNPNDDDERRRMCNDKEIVAVIEVGHG